MCSRRETVRCGKDSVDAHSFSLSVRSGSTLSPKDDLSFGVAWLHRWRSKMLRLEPFLVHFIPYSHSVIPRSVLFVSCDELTIVPVM